MMQPHGQLAPQSGRHRQLLTFWTSQPRPGQGRGMEGLRPGT